MTLAKYCREGMIHLDLSHGWRTEDANHFEHLAVVETLMWQVVTISLI
jgi:hypothetical protein